MRNLKVNAIVSVTMGLALVVAGIPRTAEAGLCSTLGEASGCVNSKDVKNNNLKGQDINESTLGEVPSATIGTSPVAYARVAASGDVIEADSRGVTDANVSLEATSAYCFRGLPFAFKTAMVSTDYASAGSTGEHVQIAKGDPFGDCSAGGGGVQLEVAGSNTTAPEGFAPVAFYIWFFN